MKLHAPRPSERTVARIPVESIRPSPYQPRRTFCESSIAELADSIREHGLLTPLLVRRVGAGVYELIAGERRLRALLQLGQSYADAIVLSVYDRDCALLALIENLQRENLHFLDEAEACRAILDEHGVTQEQLARSLSVSPSALNNRLRLLKLPESVRSSLRLSALSERHARALLRLSDEADQLHLIRETVAHHLSVKQLEARVARTLKAAELPAKRQVSALLRDNRIVINAVLDTVRELNRIGVSAVSRVEEHPDCVDVIVTIRAAEPHTPKPAASE